MGIGGPSRLAAMVLEAPSLLAAHETLTAAEVRTELAHELDAAS